MGTLGRILAASVLTLTTFCAQAETSSDQSKDYTKPYQIDALEIYRTGIAMRTAKGHENVPAYAAFLATKLRDAGFEEDNLKVIPFTTSDGETTAMLVARIKGNGASGKKPVLSIAHMDIVDALPEDWERDPFTLIEEDGYFFGRGTIDNKLGLTAVMSAFMRLKADNYVPNRDLVLAFTGDEETGMETTKALVHDHSNWTDAEYVLNSDAGGGTLSNEGTPQAFMLQAAEKTYATFELTVKNPGGHSSLPRKDNAIYELSKALIKLQDYRFPARLNDVTKGFLLAQSQIQEGPVADAMKTFVANPQDEIAGNVLFGIPSLVGITRTTCVATMLKAGHAENALAQTATATVNCRIFPGVAVADIHREIERLMADENLSVSVVGKPTAAPASPIRADVLAAMKKTLAKKYPGIPVVPYMAPYATDGKQFRAADIPTYGMGGFFMKPEEVFAHGLNERVPVAGFYDALDFWYEMLQEVTSGE